MPDPSQLYLHDDHCLAVFVSAEDVWECTWCGFTTRDDLAARDHGLSGMERMLDKLGVPD